MKKKTLQFQNVFIFYFNISINVNIYYYLLLYCIFKRWWVKGVCKLFKTAEKVKLGKERKNEREKK